MIPLGILASSVRRASAALLAPTNLVATLVEPAVSDPYWDNVVALLHFDDPVDPFKDEVGTTWVTSTGPAVSTEIGKFGGSADFYPPNVAKLASFPNATLGNFGADDFTVEAFIRLAEMPTGLFYSPFGDWGNNRGGCIFFTPGGRIRWHHGPYWMESDLSVIPLNTFVFVAYARHNGVGRLFVDGVQVAQNPDPYVYDTTHAWRLGNNATSSDLMRGYVDELRITKGVARYTENFTPPTEPFPNFGPEPTPTPLPTVIGEPYGGGFYAGDIQYPDGQWYKLIVAPIEADAYNLKWGGHGIDLPTGDNDGIANTNLMVSSATDYPAAQWCAAFDGGGNSDWYMPSLNELNVLYLNLGFDLPSTPPTFKSGGVQAFSNAWYWASTQFSAIYARRQLLSDGRQDLVLKDSNSLRVRPVRRIAFTPPPPPLPTVIGEPYGGGFYAGDTQYPDGQWYKLIVADKAADITGTNSRWKTSNTNTPDTDHLTDGVANTAAMVAAGIELHPAAEHCIGHRGGGFDDWYMPAKDELSVIYLNLGYNRPNCPPDFLSGGPQAFANAWYWASTQHSPTSGWIQFFRNGDQSSNVGKGDTYYQVRPVRRIAFTPD